MIILIVIYIDALSVAMTAPKGPIHINVPFREPLQIDLDMETPTTTLQHFTSGLH